MTYQKHDRELIFFLRNQAVSLSSLELTRALIGSQVLAQLKDLINHPFLQETIGLSKNALKKYTDQQLLLQILILEMKPELSFSGPDIMEFGGEFKGRRSSSRNQREGQ